MPKYDITVKLLNKDGNAFNILGLVSGALRRNNVSREEIAEYVASATDGDYDNLLRITMETVHIE